MNLREVHFDQTNRCRVITGNGRTYFSTPQSIGLALLGTPPEGDDVAGTAGIIWTDYLASNGVAVGVRGDRQIQLIVIPPRPRTISYVRRSDDERSQTTESLLITYPPILASLVLRRGTFERATLFIVDPARQNQLAVTNTAPILTAFPYGNVYAGTGQICWGGVRVADVRNVKDLDDLFFGSAFNRDLFDGAAAGAASLSVLARNAPNGVLPAPAAGRFTITLQTAINSTLREG